MRIGSHSTKKEKDYISHNLKFLKNYRTNNMITTIRICL